MNDLEAAIDAFKRRHLDRMKRWREAIDPDELESLIAALGEIDAESRALSQRCRDEAPETLRLRWQPLLAEMMTLMPDIHRRLQAIRGQSQSALGMIGKGQRGLTGYRRGLGADGSILDEDG